MRGVDLCKFTSAPSGPTIRPSDRPPARVGNDRVVRMTWIERMTRSQIEVGSLRGLELVGRSLEIVGRSPEAFWRSAELTFGCRSGAES